MTTEQTAQQLELAAQILRTGHPWEFKAIGGFIKPLPGTPVINPVADGTQIRLVLATPPDNRPLHNPDNLTAEQVEAGYRLFLTSEKPNTHVKLQEEWKVDEWVPSGVIYSDPLTPVSNTYRLPLSVPWPEPQPDPYADEKKTVPLGPEDVPPFCAFRRKDEPSDYIMPTSVYIGGIYGHDEIVFRHTWEYLKEQYEINRSIPLTGKWDASAWEPCHKTLT